MKRQNKTSRSLLSFLMIMAIALLASCSGNTPESPAKADTKPETETVRLAVFPSKSNTFLWRQTPKCSRG